ncbi:hypothetical protein [Aeromonas dhakensis]|uniref:hypothetical protein n=1 Tax=Aeromonas dhakensis TaxID=196024 RepID=UPI00300E3227
MVALMPVLFTLKALFAGSTELLFDLLRFHNVILFKDQFWWGAASWAAALAVLLRWTRP